MKNYLLPNRFKSIGWALFMPSFISGIIILSTDFKWVETEGHLPAVYYDDFFGDRSFFTLAKTSIVQNVTAILLIAGGLILGFTREKVEDEYITSLRLKSVMWSMLISYVLLLLLYLTVYGLFFLNIMVICMFLPLVLYIFRFHYLLYKNKNN